MGWRTCLVLLSVGLAILVGGFVYDLIFAGIPYQDPTPELQARYVYHSRIARGIETLGLVIWALGAIEAALLVVQKRVLSRSVSAAESRGASSGFTAIKSERGS